MEGVKCTQSDFAFNVELDESLFSIEPPAGYTVQTVQVDASQPMEKDLITLLRQYSTLMNNAFPETLDIDYLRRSVSWFNITHDFILSYMLLTTLFSH